jgi:methionine aminopeptidase
VYTVDVIVSSGEGRPRESEARTTIFRLSAEANYRPKMKAAQALQREVLERFTVMPFTLRAFENEASSRLGIVELLKNGAATSYPVLTEREGADLAHFKFTVLLLPGGTLKLTGLAAPDALVSEKRCEYV